MKKELKKEEIYFLARVKKIEVEHLQKMKDLLDPISVRGILIRYEFRERVKNAKVSNVKMPKSAIIALLMAKYKVSRSCIESNIYVESKWRRRVKECVICGAETSYYRWSKYNGLCQRCAGQKWEKGNDD